jgi:hypothetical protein
MQKLNVAVVENGIDPWTGVQFHGVREFYMYACGHCSSQVLLRSSRDEPEHKCYPCGRYLCDRPLCHARCTPLYALAKDRFEGGKQWGLLVPAIMAGASTPEDAIRLGFPKETFNG